VRPPAPPTGGTQPGQAAPARVVGPPAAWASSRGSPALYVIGVETGAAHGGLAAAYVSRAAATSPFAAPAASRVAAAESTGAVLSQFLRADGFRGRRVRWSGWLRTTGISGKGAGLWMRIDGPGACQGFDNMQPRMVLGTSGWEQFSVVLEVPGNAVGIALGLYVMGAGDLLADDFALEAVGDDVPVTNLMTGFEPSSMDSAATAASYARSPSAPSNLGFEGLGDVTARAAAWLAGVAVQLATTQPGPDLTDLAPLRAMVGAARVVGMGEGTHGTREFFQLKHRVFEFLVTEMGFTHFAIEATWPEANDLDRYVLTGQGDPARLLSRLYFWTWNTQEVLALIGWMRQWNLAAPEGRRVRFVGFDMQYPGAAMDSVAAFVDRVDPAKASVVSGKYACMAPYRNYGAQFQNPPSAYATLAQTERDACRRSLQEVFDLLGADSVSYSAASSDSAYSVARHSARAVQQFEEMASAYGSAASSVARDRSMAENVQWLMQQAGPGARMMLWAHNAHVSCVSPWMGSALRTAYGDEYVNLGFLFGTGGFNAYGLEGGRYTSLRAFNATLVPEGSLESVFLATGRPLLLFDTRLIAGGGSAAAPLAGPIKMRSIGAAFEPANEDGYFDSDMFPADYQLLMYVRSATASTLMRFIP